jgi:hypothetical protein
MRKTKPLHLFTFGLHRSTGPYSWVIFRPRGASELGPLFPQQQTCDDCFGMSVRCQYRKSVMYLIELFGVNPSWRGHPTQVSMSSKRPPICAPREHIGDACGSMTEARPSAITSILCRR